MENDFTVRLATPEDADFLADVRVRQLLDEGSEMIYDTRGQMADFFRRKISDGSYMQFILEKDGAFVSTAGVMFQEYPPSISWKGALRGYVSSVYTVPEHRKRGYASCLIKLIIEEARRRDLGNLWLMSSKDGIDTYRKLGFDDRRPGSDVYMAWTGDR